MRKDCQFGAFDVNFVFYLTTLGTYARFSTKAWAARYLSIRWTVSAKGTAKHCCCLDIPFVCKMVNSIQRKRVFFTEKPFEYQTQSKKCSYNDSSKIFGNGICCKKISSSNESFVVEMDVAIKWANFQHCTMSELPYFSATNRLCWHISSNKMRFSQFTCSNWQMQIEMNKIIFLHTNQIVRINGILFR